jgi:hypothetical protein
LMIITSNLLAGLRNRNIIIMRRNVQSAPTASLF